MFRRLLIALFLCVGLSLACWLLLPRVGFSVPWWVPILGFLAIAGGSVATMFERTPIADRDEFLSDDAGPSAADIERFNQPEETTPDLKIRRE
jgi:hypothetical protein